MPQTPQEPLTNLWALLFYHVRPTSQPPYNSGIELPAQIFNVEGTMAYQGDDTWYAEFSHTVPDSRYWLFYPYLTTTTLSLNLQITLNWNANQIDIVANMLPGHDNYWTQNTWTFNTPGCERGKPWYMPLQHLESETTNQNCSVTAWRPVPGTLISAIPPPFQPNSTLSLWSGSFLARGPFNDKVITYKPTYPPGHIPGVTPPSGRGAILRKKATGKIYTDYGHVRQNAAFTFAAETWAALTDAERAAWQRAAKTCKPPLHGYTLWTQLTKTKRLDRIPALEARIGETLAKPPLFP